MTMVSDIFSVPSIKPIAYSKYSEHKYTENTGQAEHSIIFLLRCIATVLYKQSQFIEFYFLF